MSKQTELGILDLKQQINFIGRHDEDETAMFFVIKKSEETTFEFPQNDITVV